MEKILKTYLKRLTNLSSSNKSIVLKKLHSEQFIDLHEADYLLNKPSFEIVAQLLKQKEKIAICDALDPRFEKGNILSKKLRKVARTDQFITEERGTNDLYVGYPFIRGRFSDGSPVHAPLLFFPVQLVLERERWHLMPRKEVGISLNQSFALAYAQFNEVTLIDEVLEKSFDEFDTDALVFRTQLYEWLKETPFKINFNQDLFQNSLQPFVPSSLGELQKNENIGELKLYPEAVLGIFPQAGSYLVPDYHQMLQQFSQEGKLHLPIFANDATISPSPNAIKEEDLLQVFPSDSSQEQVIRLAKQGYSLVVEGPPGTGKSQLICNLMADFAAAGKKVLLVCQKRAALDVVYERLKNIGLQPFLGLVHDYKNDRAALYQQLHQQIELVEEYKKLNYTLDAVVLEREFIQNSRHTDRIVHQLAEFKQALFDESICGIAIKQLYLTSSLNSHRIHLEDLLHHFRFDDGNDFSKRLKAYTNYLGLFPVDHPWAVRKSFATYTHAELQIMQRWLKAWPTVVKTQQNALGTFVDVPFSFTLLSKRRTTIEQLHQFNEQPKAPVSLLQAIASLPPTSLQEQQAQLVAIIHEIENSLFWENSLTYHDSTIIQETVDKGITAKSSLLGLKWSFLPSTEKDILQKICAANQLACDKEGFVQLSEALQTKIAIVRRVQTLGIAILDTARSKAEYLTILTKYVLALEKMLVLRQVTPSWQSIILQELPKASTAESFQSLIEQIIHWLQAWNDSLKELNSYFTDSQIQQLYRQPDTYAAMLSATLEKHFEDLVEADQLWYTMSSPEKEVVNRLLELPDTSSREMVLLFENSLKIAWIEYIEGLFPILRAVSSQKMTQWEEYLQENITNNQQLSREIALIRLREDTYHNLESNRLGNRLTYRELNHQVTKKRKIWPIRRLLEKYHDEILRLIPCWMASPDSVSTIFPLEESLFDLVIFDEASQCYAEYGLPAIYRGKQVIITGDTKQLPPSNLYRVRFEEYETEDSDYIIATEITSLLDLANQYLLSKSLTGHYRSKSLELIDFSNRHFYNGRLQLLPDFHYLNQQSPAIAYIKTEGRWHQNKNEIEALQVVALVRELLHHNKSIGIVTFNYFQQQLIQDLLEQEQVTHPDLFVKNIENVQGDERDFIIFSLGYAPDLNGRMTMQFGLLTMPGGENRLNVAITRAKEKVYVVTSIWPSQLAIEQATHEGPKLLKAYLEYAHQVAEGNFVPYIRQSNYYVGGTLLKTKLAEKNTTVETVFPFADLTIRQDNRFKGLILTDDETYYQSLSPKDPHAYLPLLLQQKHWPYQRIYSRQYWLGEEMTI